MAAYRKEIEGIVPGYPAHQVEAYMRVAYSTLDGLSRHEFAREARLAAACIDEGGPEMAERVASSFGLGETLRRSLIVEAYLGDAS